MKAKTENSGLRKHRPRKRFRFEYIKGKYSLMTTEQRYWRWFSEREREEFGYEQLQSELDTLRLEDEETFSNS